MKFSTPLLALFGVLISAPAQATVVKWMSLAEKTQISAVVVHGTIERVESEWEVEGAKVRTVATVLVKEAIKGDLKPGERFVLRRGGGKIGDFEQTAPGLSEYEPGEEVILFLEPYGPFLIEVGIGIGKYDVDFDGRQHWVNFKPRVAALKPSTDGRPAQIEELEPMEATRLDAFLKEVRSYARGIPTDTVVKPRKGASLKAPLPTVQGR